MGARAGSGATTHLIASIEPLASAESLRFDKKIAFAGTAVRSIHNLSVRTPVRQRCGEPAQFP
jgi:hypothetical protein